MTKFCPECGEELIDSAKFCKNCGTPLKNEYKTSQTYEVPEVEKNYTLITVIGYILAFLMPIIAIAISFYLLTRKNSQKASKHGKYIIIISVIWWILSIILVGW